MSLGTLYYFPTFRSAIPIVLINELNLDIKLVNVRQENSEEFVKKFPLKKIPAFVGSDGYEVHETLAIIYYFVTLSKTPSNLYGSTPKEVSSVTQWLSFFNTDFWFALRPIVGPIHLGHPYVKEDVDAAIKDGEKFFSVLENRLASHKYLVTDHVTVADYFAVALVQVGFQHVWGKEFIAQHPAIFKWFDDLINKAPLTSFYPNTPYKYLEKPKEYPAPK